MLGGYYLGQLYLGISGLPAAGILSVPASSHQLSSGNIALTQKQTLVVNSDTHSLTSVNITLTQKHLLTVENAIHTLMSENVAITSEQVLGINNAFHGVTSPEIALTQKHTIVVNNTTHTVLSGNLELVEHKTLAVNNTVHGHTAEGNIPIVVHFYLVVANNLHGQTVPNLALTQKQLLVVANTLHGVISTVLGGLINIQPDGMGGGFGAVDGFAAAEYGSINKELPLNYIIVTASTHHSLFDNFTSFSQKHTLDPDDDVITITTPNLLLWEMVFRYSGVYIKDFEDEGAMGGEYTPETGTSHTEKGFFGLIAPEPDSNNGFLVTKMGSSGSLVPDTINGGNFIGTNKGQGDLSADEQDTGIYTIKHNNNGEYEEV
jgi:hypothetical protein